MITGRKRKAAQLPLPRGKPVWSGPRQTTMADARLALGKARRYLTTGGSWCPALREYVDGWLDFMCADRYLRRMREELPEAPVRHDGQTRRPRP